MKFNTTHMMIMNPPVGALALLAACLASPLTLAQYDVSWWTVAGGGEMFSTGGGYELGGTIGQTDAGPPGGPMSGGGFDLAGGFWQQPLVTTCGDANCDGVVDGADIDPFFRALGNPTQWLATYSCDFVVANDANRDGAVDGADIDAFFAALATGHCP